MGTIHFVEGRSSGASIELKQPENRLSRGVESPGEDYMTAAFEVLKAIRQSLSDYAELPKVEDVAYHLLDLLPPQKVEAEAEDKAEEGEEEALPKYYVAQCQVGRGKGTWGVLERPDGRGPYMDQPVQENMTADDAMALAVKLNKRANGS